MIFNTVLKYSYIGMSRKVSVHKLIIHYKSQTKVYKNFTIVDLQVCKCNPYVTIMCCEVTVHA